MAESPWLTPDNTGNVLVVSGSRSYVAENPPGYQTAPSWFSDVISSTGSAREADYRAFQVSGGDPVANARSCCISHARNGENDTQSWNHATTGTANDGSPVCRLLVSMGTADFAVGSGGPSHVSETGTGGIGGAYARGATKAVCDAVYVGEIRRYLGPEGVLDLPDPVADGYPVDSVLVWEDDLALSGVEVAVDTVEVSPSSTDVLVASINDAIRPAFISGDWDVWPLGVPPQGGVEHMADGVTEKPHIVLDQDPLMPYFEYTGLDDWAKCFDKSIFQEPDFTVSRFTSGAFYGWSGTASGVNYEGVAIRVTLRSPRYRWAYEGGPVPRRFRGRDDELAGGAGRFGGQSTSGQRSNRFAGGYV